MEYSGLYTIEANINLLAQLEETRDYLSSTTFWIGKET